jgi:hypothetical protein
MMDEVLVQGDRIEYHWTLIGTNTTIETIRQMQLPQMSGG